MEAELLHIIKSKPWLKSTPPQRILAIRLQATGDMVITLPYLQYLKNHLPENSVIDFVTREEVEDIAKNIFLFNKVYSIRGGRDLKKQFLYAGLLLPELLLNKYDVVIDLQNNEISNLIRKTVFPKAWSSFDRFSPLPAGMRTSRTIEAIGLGKCGMDTIFQLKNPGDGMELLKDNGWLADHELIILNPAGAFENRNWPLENYVSFASSWLQEFPQTQFLLIGTNVIDEKASYLKNKLGGQLINLVNKTTPAQAFSIIQKIKLMLSEDSGLMHMSWVSGIPTIALFGSTRSDWARPLGTHSFFFDSSNLECGSCMQPVCKYGDNHCMTDISPGMVFEKAASIFRSVGN